MTQYLVSRSGDPFDTELEIANPHLMLGVGSFVTLLVSAENPAQAAQIAAEEFDMRVGLCHLYVRALSAATRYDSVPNVAYYTIISETEPF